MNANQQSFDNFSFSDDSQNSPRENFMRDFIVDFMRDFPQVLQQMSQNRPDVSQYYPDVSFSNGEDCGHDHHGGNDPDYGRPDGPEPTDPEPQPDNERAPYNRLEYGANKLEQAFDDIDVNQDNRLTAKEVRKYLRDEVQNPFDKNSIKRVLDHWDGVRKQSIDGPYGASKTDLQRFAQRQVERGVQNRYPGP